MTRRPLDELFRALGDPTRRRLLESLVHAGPRTATALADETAITRQGVAKHLGVLAAAGLVTAERHGREQRYRATTDELADAVDWLLRTSARWDERGAALRRVSAPPPP